MIAITHGHGDHVGDTVELSKSFPDAQIVAQVELKGWLGGQGANVGPMPGLNKGGSHEIDGIRFTLVNAFHSSSSDDGEYLGEACGIVVQLEGGKTVYFAGDTCVFGDMALIRRLYAPDFAVLPIGDYFTMGPREAAVALELLGNPRCVPCHWGTFPLLTGTPDAAPRRGAGGERDRHRPGRDDRALSHEAGPLVATYSIAACDLERGAVGRRDAVEVPGRRLGRAVGRARTSARSRRRRTRTRATGPTGSSCSRRGSAPPRSSSG